MATKVEPITRFKPERPIYLHESNTGFKTKDQVIVAVEELRELGWLACYNEKIRPIHMSFNDVREFTQFKKACGDLGVKLKEPIVKPDELEELMIDEPIVPVEPKSDYEDPSGKIHLG